MEIIGDLICERVALDIKLPELVSKVGDYTLLESPNNLMVPDVFKATVSELGDTNPMFITVAVPIGKSRSLSSDSSVDRPHRMWPEHVMDTLSTRIRESALPGYRGHANDADGLNTLPNPAVLWLSAAKGEKTTGERAILTRGYVYDIDNNRYFLKTGAFNTVSPMAMASMTPEVVDGEPVMVVEQANWLSLDFVRKNTEGIRGAAVVSMEGAAVNMLTPEQRKLIAELGLADLEEFNPKLVSEISKKPSGKTDNSDNELIVKLTDRVQALTRENANLIVERSYLDQIATIVGCKVDELSGKMSEFAQMRVDSVKMAAEAAIAKLGDFPLKDIIAKRIKEMKFGTAKEAEDAVTAEVADAKEYVAAVGVQFGLGSVNASHASGKGSSVLSGFGQRLVGGS